MPTIPQFLAAHVQEDLPAWLANLDPAAAFPCTEFFASRLVYYPESRDDGQGVQVFGSAHAAHCFIYADRTLDQHGIEALLHHPGFDGYTVAASTPVTQQQLPPGPIQYHLQWHEIPVACRRPPSIRPFGLFVLLEREPARDDSHGARRLAILFLGADGVAAYDALFCQDGRRRVPFGMVLRDHGNDGEDANMGAGGPLHVLATRCAVQPKYLLVGHNTTPWPGYAQAQADPHRGGPHGHEHLRALWVRTAN